MIAAPSRGMSATLVALVCLAGAVGAGFVVGAMSDRWDLIAISAVIAGMTGLAAALAMMLFSRSPQSASATTPASPKPVQETCPQPGPPRQPERGSQGNPAAAPSAPPPTANPGLVTTSRPSTHGSRSAAAPAATDGEPQTARVSPPAARPESQPDPRMTALQTQHSALLNEYRTLLAQRAALLRGLAELVGLLPEAFGWQAANLLKGAGVREVMPAPGTRFDPVLHHVLGTKPTPDASAHDTVAHTSRSGWLDRDHVLVPAHVVLYAVHVPPEDDRTDDQQ